MAWPLLAVAWDRLHTHGGDVEPTELTIELLKSIRDEVRETNVRVDRLRDELTGELRSTNARLDALREETGARFERLEHRQVETEVRLATELVAVAGAVREVRDLLREDRAVRQKVEDHERRIAAIEARIG
jgi:hypothetical protein